MQVQTDGIGILRLLVVDDDPLVRLLVRETLGGPLGGPVIDEAETLSIARGLLHLQRYDCMLLDLGLPDGDGGSLLDELAGPERPAVVVLTGQGERELALRMLRAGVEDFLDKQVVDGAAIRRAVQFAMARHTVRLSAERHAGEMARLAEYDPLTGLLNRRGQQDALALMHPDRRWGLLLDVDDFKQINDRHGHGAGDRVLQAVATGLSDGSRPDDSVARVGGDEFLVLFSADAPETAWVVAERLKVAVSRALAATAITQLDRQPVTVSLGLAAMPPMAASVEDLLACCARPLGSSKRGGKDRIAQARPAVGRAGLIRELDHMTVELQPIRDARTRLIVGAEVSVNAQPRGRSLPDILGDARASGALPEVEAALVALRVDAILSANVPGTVVLPLLSQTAPHPLVLEQLRRVVESGWPGQVVVTLWGDPGGADPTALAALRTQLSEAGVRVGVARVGRGGTSLEAIGALRPVLLRLDRALVQRLDSTAEAAQQAARIVQVGKVVGASVLAPGVASAAARRLLLSMGVGLWTEEERAGPSPSPPGSVR